jgi:undecaprenyl-diphosphatase
MPIAIQAALLGIVQGLTEFLPVSSSAHLILARAFFGWDSDQFGLSFDVACHVGTLIAVLIYFRREVAAMIASLPRLFQPARDPDARMIWLLAAGTLPAIVAGLLFNKSIEEQMRTPTVAAIALAAGAIGLLIAERAGSHTRRDDLTMGEALLIGGVQAVALLPGVSRSGATMTVALLLGLRRADAARFIFLLAIPAILAAAGHEAPRTLRAGLGGDQAMLFLIGVVSSAIVGYAAVRFFIRYLVNHSLDPFAWYRLALAAAVTVWLLRA